MKSRILIAATALIVLGVSACSKQEPANEAAAVDMNAGMTNEMSADETAMNMLNASETPANDMAVNAE